MPTITTATRGSVYVLKRHRNGRSRHSYGRPETWQILDKYFNDLPAHVQDAFVALEERERVAVASRREWALRFIQALDDGDDFLPRQRANAVIRYDAPPSEMTTREAALVALWEAEEKGLTASEVKRYTGITSDGISGALSELTQAGVVVRLEETR